MEFESTYLVLGNLHIRYYGIIIVLALLVGASAAAEIARRSGQNSDHIWGGLTWAILPGIIGARLWFVLFPPAALTAGCGSEAGLCQDTAWYFANFFDLQNGAIAVWSGGLGIFGAGFGALFGVYLYLSPWHNRILNLLTTLLTPLLWLWQLAEWSLQYAWQRLRSQEARPFRYRRPRSDFPDDGLPLSPWLDIAAVAIPLGQAVGRFANYVNQELYGSPTNLPWGIQIPREARVAPYESLVDYPIDTLFHPIWAYEALWNVLAFFVLWRVYHRYRARLRSGDIFLLYILQYTFLRFLLEFLRVEVAHIGTTGINSSQAITALAFVLALVAFLQRQRQASPPSSP